MIRNLRLEEQLRGGNEEGKFKEAPAGEKTLAQIASDFGMSPETVKAWKQEGMASHRNEPGSAPADGYGGRSDDSRAPFIEGRLRCGAALPIPSRKGLRCVAPHDIR